METHAVRFIGTARGRKEREREMERDVRKYALTRNAFMDFLSFEFVDVVVVGGDEDIDDRV